MDVALSYGRRGLTASLPDANVRHILRFQPMPAIDDAREATRLAVSDPIGCEPLRDIACGRGDACIVTSDITRPVPNEVILPVLLAELACAGLPPERVTILIGTGSHRGNTPDELREMLGDETMESGARIVNHDAHDPEAQVAMGETSRGTPAHVNRLYAEADLKLAVSLVEPHLIAGFSGGRKAICPGVCGMETLLSFHSPPLVNPDEACAGQIHGNPAHEESLAVTRLAGAPELMVNVTLDEVRRVTGVFAGELEAAHLAAVAHSYKQGRSTIDEPVDIVLTSAAGHPLDLTFYQSVKGIAGPVGIVKPGGTIIIACECAEGIGDPPLVDALFETDKLEDYVPRMTDAAYFHMDQWYAQFTKIRRVAGDVMVFTDGVPNQDLAKCFVTPIDSVEEGVAAAIAKHGPDASIAVLPEGPYVLSCLAGDRIDRQSF